MIMAVSAMESLVRSFANGHPADAARALESLDANEAARVLKRLPPRLAGRVIERLAPQAAGAILTQIGAEGTRALLAEVPTRQAAAILHHLEDAMREAAVSGLAPEQAKRIRGLLQYPSDTAGGMMDPHITALRLDVSVGEAIKALRRAPRQTLYYVYVVDADGKLVGVLNVRELLLASTRDRIEPMVRRDLVTIPATLPRDELAELVRQHRFIALPVVDSEGYLLGVVKPDEILATVQEEAFADLQKMVST
jgi:magnesium transporter